MTGLTIGLNSRYNLRYITPKREMLCKLIVNFMAKGITRKIGTMAKQDFLLQLIINYTSKAIKSFKELVLPKFIILTIEEELQMQNFASEQMKAELNLLFTASWLYNKISIILKKHNLSNEQYNVLRILRGQKGKAICQKDILARMLDRNSNLTLIITKLRDKNLVEVEKSQTDKRAYRIKITQEGMQVLAQVENTVSLEKKNLANLTESEAFHLNALLNKARSK